MNKQEFAKGVKILELTYNQKFDEEKRDFWFRQLQDLNASRYFNNIKNIIKTSTFMPNIAQLRNEPRKQFADYEQRDYSNINLNQFYANKGVINK